jgi:hypothetical protein
MSGGLWGFRAIPQVPGTVNTKYFKRHPNLRPVTRAPSAKARAVHTIMGNNQFFAISGINFMNETRIGK